MNIEPIATIKTDFPEKFGIPRQSGRAGTLTGVITFLPKFRNPEAVKGLSEYNYIWLLWKFDVPESETFHATVRPPRLGGNERVGVFASRSPFRPNGLGLSAVRIERVEPGGDIIVRGADLMDGTPIYDIKPYVAEADAHPEARSGFVDRRQWQRLKVVWDKETGQDSSGDEKLKNSSGNEWWAVLEELLSLDPRPHYHESADRIYGMPYDGFDVRFRVVGDELHVLSIVKISGENQK